VPWAPPDLAVGFRSGCDGSTNAARAREEI
jgi:hypothetical protein